MGTNRYHFDVKNDGNRVSVTVVDLLHPNGDTEPWSWRNTVPGLTDGDVERWALMLTVQAIIGGIAAEDKAVLVREAFAWTSPNAVPVPIPMLLACPHCRAKHVDEPNAAEDWDNPPHRSHKCGSCGYVWRPSDSYTVGVERIETAGKGDSPRMLTWGPASPIIQAIRNERDRAALRYGMAHDDEHGPQELALAAAYFAGAYEDGDHMDRWPSWVVDEYDRIQAERTAKGTWTEDAPLIIAGAFIVASVECRRRIVGIDWKDVEVRAGEAAITLDNEEVNTLGALLEVTRVLLPEDRRTAPDGAVVDAINELARKRVSRSSVERLISRIGALAGLLSPSPSRVNAGRFSTTPGSAPALQNIRPGGSKVDQHQRFPGSKLRAVEADLSGRTHVTRDVDTSAVEVTWRCQDCSFRSADVDRVQEHHNQAPQHRISPVDGTGRPVEGLSLPGTGE